MRAPSGLPLSKSIEAVVPGEQSRDPPCQSLSRARVSYRLMPDVHVVLGC